MAPDSCPLPSALCPLPPVSYRGLLTWVRGVDWPLPS